MIKVGIMKIYFATHATTIDNEDKIASGWKDVGLSKLGIQQANEMKEHVNYKIPFRAYPKRRRQGS